MMCSSSVGGRRCPHGPRAARRPCLAGVCCARGTSIHLAALSRAAGTFVRQSLLGWSLACPASLSAQQKIHYGRMHWPHLMLQCKVDEQKINMFRLVSNGWTLFLPTFKYFLVSQSWLVVAIFYTSRPAASWGGLILGPFWRSWENAFLVVLSQMPSTCKDRT